MLSHRRLVAAVLPVIARAWPRRLCDAPVPVETSLFITVESFMRARACWMAPSCLRGFRSRLPGRKAASSALVSLAGSGYCMAQAETTALSKVNLLATLLESEMESATSSLHKRRTSLRANRGCQLGLQTLGS